MFPGQGGGASEGGGHVGGVGQGSSQAASHGAHMHIKNEDSWLMVMLEQCFSLNCKPLNKNPMTGGESKEERWHDVPSGRNRQDRLGEKHAGRKGIMVEDDEHLEKKRENRSVNYKKTNVTNFSQKVGVSFTEMVKGNLSLTTRTSTRGSELENKVVVISDEISAFRFLHGKALTGRTVDLRSLTKLDVAKRRRLSWNGNSLYRWSFGDWEPECIGVVGLRSVVEDVQAETHRTLDRNVEVHESLEVLMEDVPGRLRGGTQAINDGAVLGGGFPGANMQEKGGADVYFFKSQGESNKLRKRPTILSPPRIKSRISISSRVKRSSDEDPFDLDRILNLYKTRSLVADKTMGSNASLISEEESHQEGVDNSGLMTDLVVQEAQMEGGKTCESGVRR
ncbi:hypothetical protein L1987_80655 [Smallanthus sonchifolius]|uniref:Uncharacterized protein n=1 Tax=Smallanthus sonchifolius TaxID=185202 RepID=A0ACB8YSI8_9ASTR|nr:hypothetical protein L1987_80655 [Smallanthus sonchifolius]